MQNLFDRERFIGFQRLPRVDKFHKSKFFDFLPPHQAKPLFIVFPENPPVNPDFLPPPGTHP
jgi:hypothetical protein